MNRNICPVCANGRLVEKRGRYETQFVDRSGERRYLVVPDLVRDECEACGEAFLNDFATRQLESARRAATGLLSAPEIRELRVRLGKTQSQMSTFLGIGEKTYCRWESGLYVQSIGFDNYLRLVRELPEAVHFLDELQRGEFQFFPPQEEVEPVFPFLTDISSISEKATAFTGLLEKGVLFVGRDST